MNRSRMSGAFTVGGVEGTFPTVGSAISRALTLVERSEVEDRQTGVFRLSRDASAPVRVARVRRENGVTYVEEVVRDEH